MRKVGGGTTGSVYNVTTNGTLFTPENLEDLELHNTHINMSFDGLPSTQNRWRGGSYDMALKHLDLLLEYPSLTILKLMVDPTTLYDDIEHIHSLGFSSVFINDLNAYSEYTYAEYSIEDWKKEYTRVIADFNDPPNFEVIDFRSWGEILTKTQHNKLIGCGYVFKGLGVAPDGKLYPCHQGPSLGEEFSIGDVWSGVDGKKEAIIRAVKNAPSCTRCVYRMSKCYVQMYLKHGRFGVDAPPWSREWEIAKLELVAELKGIEMPGPHVCREDHFDNALENLLRTVDDFFVPGGERDENKVHDNKPCTQL